MTTIQKEEIDSGFTIQGTKPEREVLYDLLKIILNSNTGKPLLKLLHSKKKVGIAFKHKDNTYHVKKERHGHFNPFFNQISLNIVSLRSKEARISTLTHELFHALQYHTGTFHNHLNKEDLKKAVLLNELEARFKSMEIISELYPYKAIINLDLDEQTKMDCLIYQAVSSYYKNALMKSGQKSDSKATKIAKLLAKSEILEAQVSEVPDELHHLIGDIWSGEFQAVNTDWHNRCRKYQDEWENNQSVFRFLLSKKKPKLTEISSHISNRLGIPHAFFQKKVAEKIWAK